MGEPVARPQYMRILWHFSVLSVSSVVNVCCMTYLHSLLRLCGKSLPALGVLGVLGGLI